MHKTKPTRLGVIASTALCAFLAALLPQVARSQTPGGCVQGGQAAFITVAPVVAHEGDTITITSLGFGANVNSCLVENGSSYLIYPNGAQNIVASGNGLDGAQKYQNLFSTTSQGASLFCLGGITIGGVANCLPVTLTYVVNKDDINRTLSFTTPPTPGGNTVSGLVGGSPNKVKFLVVSAADLTGNPGLSAGGPGNAEVLVVTPAIDVTKECVSACTPYSQAIQFKGTVKNIGTIKLINVSVTDDPAGATISETPIDYGDVMLNGVVVRAWNGELNPGEYAAYSGAYTPSGTSLCGPFSDTVTATGTDTSTATGFVPKTVTDTASVTCYVSTDPKIALTKDCFKTDAAGNLLSPKTRDLKVNDYYAEEFVVSNTGNVPLKNVKIVDSIVGNIEVGDLAIGASVTKKTAARLVKEGDCPGITDKAYATGDNVCPADVNSPCKDAYKASATSDEVTCTVTVTCPPKLAVTKEVVCLEPVTGTCDAETGYAETASGVVLGANGTRKFCYKIVVSNVGEQAVKTITVKDEVLGYSETFTPVPPLAIGASLPAIYLNKDLPVGTTINTVFVNGTGAVTAEAAPEVSDSATAVVTYLAVECGIVLTSADDKDGKPADNNLLLPTGKNGTTITDGFKLTIKNTGNTPVLASAAVPAGVTACDAALTGIKIAATSEVTITCDLVVDCNSEIKVNVTATPDVQGSCVAGANGLPVEASTACTATIKCVPEIAITKDVVCVEGNVTSCDDPDAVYTPSASGVVVDKTGTRKFCYRIVVKNLSDEEIDGLEITDSLLTLPVYPKDNLPAGGELVLYVDADWTPGTYNNVVEAYGTGATTGIKTETVKDQADVVVKYIDVACSIVLSATDDMDPNKGENADNHLLMPIGWQSSTVTDGFLLTIENKGQEPIIANAAVTPAQVVANCAPALTGIKIPAGDKVTVICDLTVTCATDIKVDVTATYDPPGTGPVPCYADGTTGEPIEDTTTCTARIDCEQPITCRVTGGGVLLPDTIDQSCVPVPTLIEPMVSLTGLQIKKITHGGQLGAPFSQQDCGQTLSNPCIRGQWQHVRHYVGAGNPRDLFNFHSNTPKGMYDSLLCACLGCCTVNGEGELEWIGPSIVNGLCNPDDHKVCGPEPRPAPANSIIFSGVGTLTPETDIGKNAKAATWVVFRVYIEDRSEPGGHHPKGAVEPADIYVFQAWNTGIPAWKSDPSGMTMANGVTVQDLRKALAADSCAFVRSLTTPDGSEPAVKIGTLPSKSITVPKIVIVNGEPVPVPVTIQASVYDMGPMDTGNHQIHPSTSATCQ